jgi:hypothetical protein
MRTLRLLRCIGTDACAVRVLLAALSLVSVFCSDQALFNENDHLWSYPAAFVAGTDKTVISIADTAGLLKNISTPVRVQVHLLGFITNPRPGKQLEGRWSFGDGLAAVTAVESSFFVKHAFTAPGVYTAVFTVSDGAGNSLSDSVSVTVSTPPLSPGL